MQKTQAKLTCNGANSTFLDIQSAKLNAWSREILLSCARFIPWFGEKLTRYKLSHNTACGMNSLTATGNHIKFQTRPNLALTRYINQVKVTACSGVCQCATEHLLIAAACALGSSNVFRRNLIINLLIWPKPFQKRGCLCAYWIWNWE